MKRRNNGFTLVELIIVFSLLGIVLSGLYMVIEYSQRAYTSTEARSIVQDDINRVVGMIGADIRSARKPNQDTRAVVIASGGQLMNIYTQDGDVYRRICYRLDPADKSVLQKGWVETTSYSSAANPEYETITNWETILKGVVYEENGIQLAIFSDITPADSEPTDKRLIRIDIKALDEKGRLLEAIEMPLVFSTRSKN